MLEGLKIKIIYFSVIKNIKNGFDFDFFNADSFILELRKMIELVPLIIVDRL